jgi:hypothetical protein
MTRLGRRHLLRLVAAAVVPPAVPLPERDGRALFLGQTPLHVMSWRNRVSQNETVAFIEVTRRIYLQDREAHHGSLGLSCLNQTSQEKAADAMPLIGR